MQPTICYIAQRRLPASNCTAEWLQVYFVDFTNVAALLSFRDFIRFLLPLKVMGQHESISTGWRARLA